MGKLLQDLRYGARRLWKSPGFALVAAVSLALGIRANTAIFSLIDTVLLRPLPVERPAELYKIFGTLNNGADVTIQSHLNYKEYRDRNEVFSGVLAYRFAPMSLSRGAWQRRFGGDPSIINRQITLNGRAFTVVGVAPEGFVGTEVAYAPEVWVPMMMAREIEPGSGWLESRDSDNIFAVGRLRPGVTAR